MFDLQQAEVSSVETLAKLLSLADPKPLGHLAQTLYEHETIWPGGPKLIRHISLAVLEKEEEFEQLLGPDYAALQSYLETACKRLADWLLRALLAQSHKYNISVERGKPAQHVIVLELC